MDEIIEKIRQFAVKLEDNVDCVKLDDIADELEYLRDDQKENTIIDVDRFKRMLENQSLLTKELDEFIDNYMRFDNV